MVTKNLIITVLIMIGCFWFVSVNLLSESSPATTSYGQQQQELDSLQELKQRRDAKWAEIEAVKFAGDGSSCLELARLSCEHGEIVSEIREKN